MDAKTHSPKSGHKSGMPDAAMKYRAYPPINIPDRTWPTKTITKAPIWCSVDLRDGNQSLVNPMGHDRKARMFKHAARHGLQGNRDRFPVRLADGLRLRPLVRGRGRRAGRRVHAGPGPVPAGADHPHLRISGGRPQADHPLLQLDLRAAAPRSVRQGRRRYQADRGGRGQDDHRHGSEGRQWCKWGFSFPVFAGKLYRHRTGSGAGNLQCRHRGDQADRRGQADPQSALDGGDGDPERLRGPDRMDVPQSRQP
jgi:hypothetical protein